MQRKQTYMTYNLTFDSKESSTQLNKCLKPAKLSTKSEQTERCYSSEIFTQNVIQCGTLHK